MDAIAVFIFLSSGLFLGWSLGANDAANVFGTAVGSRMIRFSTAAFLCSVFVILGAVIGGAGAAGGLGELGSLNALPGAFTVALSAAMTVLWMTQLGLPVSTSQAVVGAIIGWNLFSGAITDLGVLSKIALTWVACPVLGAIFAALLYRLLVSIINRTKPHLLQLDLYTRWGLILAGIFGSYALGANNIGNVMGVFIPSSPFTEFHLGETVRISSTQQLFLLGGIAIAIGVYTYSKGVMMTVGGSLMKLSPIAAFVVVVAHSLVLFVFSSTELQQTFINLGLPPIPLIPVSSSQAVIGAVIGIGLLQGMRGVRQIRWRVLGEIGSGWVSTPAIATLISIILLFIVQNVFNQPVYEEINFRLSQPVLMYLQKEGVPTEKIAPLEGQTLTKPVNFRSALRRVASLTPEQESQVIAAAELYPMHITPEAINKIDSQALTPEQFSAIERLTGQSFDYKWELQQALGVQTTAWQKQPGEEHLDDQFLYLEKLFITPKISRG